MPATRSPSLPARARTKSAPASRPHRWRALVNVENLTGTNAAGQTLTGNGSANVITGAGGNDVDRRRHRRRHDARRRRRRHYFVDNAGDVVIEACRRGLRHRLCEHRAICSGRGRGGRGPGHDRQYGDHGDQPDRQRARQLHRRQCRGEHARRRRRRRTRSGAGRATTRYFVDPGDDVIEYAGARLRHRLCARQLRALAGHGGRGARHDRQSGDHFDQPQRQRGLPITSPAMPGRTCSTAAAARTSSGAARATTPISPTWTTSSSNMPATATI